MPVQWLNSCKLYLDRKWQRQLAALPLVCGCQTWQSVVAAAAVHKITSTKNFDQQQKKKRNLFLSLKKKSLSQGLLKMSSVVADPWSDPWSRSERFQFIGRWEEKSRNSFRWLTTKLSRKVKIRFLGHFWARLIKAVKVSFEIGSRLELQGKDLNQKLEKILQIPGS